MKNKFITICVILAAILAFMSFTAVLMPKNATDSDVDEPETTTEEKEPVIKEFKVYGVGTSVTERATFSYEEGMTWAEFIESDYNDFSSGVVITVQNDDVYFNGSEVVAASGTTDEDGYIRPVDRLDVSLDDVISYEYYYIEE